MANNNTNTERREGGLGKATTQTMEGGRDSKCKQYGQGRAGGGKQHG